MLDHRGLCPICGHETRTKIETSIFAKVGARPPLGWPVSQLACKLLDRHFDLAPIEQSLLAICPVGNVVVHNLRIAIRRLP